MITIAVEKKGNSYIAAAIHLPTSTRTKCSTQSEAKSIAKCIADINDAVGQYDWLYSEDSGMLIDSLTFNDVLTLSANNLKRSDLEDAIDRASAKYVSLHCFSKDHKTYTAYTFTKGINVAALFEALFAIDGAEYGQTE